MENREYNPTQGIGTSMSILATVVTIALFSVLFSRISGQQENPNQHVISQSANGRTEVRLQQNHQGHYIANGKINGQAVTFMLDTGASLISVPEQVANRLGLRAGPQIQVNTANGSVAVALTRLHSVSLGEIELYDIKAAINPHVDDDMILLGMSFLKDLELVQRHDELIIRRQ